MGRHRFKIGTEVGLASRAGLFPSAAATYRITALLPDEGLSPQYRLRNDESAQERVAREDDLYVAQSGSHPGGTNR